MEPREFQPLFPYLWASEPQARASDFPEAIRKPHRPLIHASRAGNVLEPWGSEAHKYFAHSLEACPRGRVIRRTL